MDLLVESWLIDQFILIQIMSFDPRLTNPTFVILELNMKQIMKLTHFFPAVSHHAFVVQQVKVAQFIKKYFV